MSARAAIGYERILEREGLRALDYDDGAGGISVGNRGSGKILDASRAMARASGYAEMQQRQVVLHTHRFRRGERRVYAMYASGVPIRVIARRLGTPKTNVHRCVARIEREHRTAPERRMSELVEACEPATLVLVFALLERALEAPRVVRELLSAARAVPELKQLFEPEDMRDG